MPLLILYTKPVHATARIPILHVETKQINNIICTLIHTSSSLHRYLPPVISKSVQSFIIKLSFSNIILPGNGFNINHPH